MSVEEDSLRVAMDRAGHKGDGTLKRVSALFPILGEKRRFAVLNQSGWQHQIVVIGRVLLNQPCALRSDEISLGLTPKVIREIYAALPSIRQAGTALVLVDRHVSFAKSASDRLYCMLEGRMTLTGNSAGVSRDANRRSACIEDCRIVVPWLSAPCRGVTGAKASGVSPLTSAPLARNRRLRRAFFGPSQCSATQNPDHWPNVALTFLMPEAQPSRVL